MSFENFSTKWFALYYIVVSFCLLGGGSYLILKKQQVADFLLASAEKEKPPRIFIRILKYFFLFTLPGVVLSFMPFSWIELLFSFWSLLLVYVMGLQLVRWDQSRKLVRDHSRKLLHFVSRIGAIMVAVGFAIFLLVYLVINRAPV